MGRAALRVSLTELARLSGVSEKTIRRCEAVDGPPPVADHTLTCIIDAFNKHGVRFMEGRRRTDGPGVILDWNPEVGTREEVLALVKVSGDPYHGPKHEWPPLPQPLRRKR